MPSLRRARGDIEITNIAESTCLIDAGVLRLTAGAQGQV
jgi:hypothetical protein